MPKIAILGKDGVTGKALLQYLSQNPYWEQVSEAEADIVVTSPGIPPSQYLSHQRPVISELDFASQEWQRKAGKTPALIGITGTNGKTTVTEMIAHILQCPSAGNIGSPLISFVDTEATAPTIAVECSSYQLESSHQFHPHIALILNISPDHLERHGSMAQYAKEKERLSQNQGPNDHLILWAHCPFAEGIASRTKATLHWIGEQERKEIQSSCPNIQGLHNQYNAAFALKAASLATQQEQAILLQRLQGYTPAAHRMEAVPISADFSVINDSKSTNPAATIAAIETDTRPTHLILCGQDKQLPFQNFSATLCKQAQLESVSIVGGIAARLTPILQDMSPKFSIHSAADISSCISESWNRMKAGQRLLFSPSASSFDHFSNYKERGAYFKAEIQRLDAEEGQH